jgi:hypothetical protein
VKNILVIAGLGVVAAMAFLYLAPKIKPKGDTIVVRGKTAVKGVKAIAPVYPPVQVNMPNNADKPIQKEYLGMDFAGATFRR